MFKIIGHVPVVTAVRVGIVVMLTLMSSISLSLAQTPQMTWGKGAIGSTNYFWVKNFSGNTFGTAASNQFYLNWKMDNTINGKGGEIWFFTSSATETGKLVDTAQNINYVPGNDCGNSWGDFGLQIGSNYPKSSSSVSAVPTYTVIESSTVRVRIKTNERNVSQNGDFFNINTQWTIYPNGQIFRWDSIPSISANDSIKMTFQGFFADSQQLESVYLDTTRLFGGLRNSSKVHNFGVASLGMRNGAGVVVRPWMRLILQFGHDAGRMGPEFLDDAVPYAAWNTFPLQNVFYVDIRSNSIDSLAMDSLSQSLRQPGTLAFSTGTAVSTSAGDINNDGFNEREGAYVAAATGNTVHFTLPGTAALCRFSPAFRITGYTATVKPVYVYVDSVRQTEGTHYNAYVNTASGELIVQCMATYRKNSDIYISAAQPLIPPPKPGSLAYVTNPLVVTAGTSITQNNCVVAGGGAIDSFSVTPALPAGLLLNRMSGAVTGTPVAAISKYPYTITARNASGISQIDLEITVRVAAPGTLSYSRNPAVFIMGQLITPDTLRVNGGGAIDSFTVAPALPAGLLLGNTNGLITGTPLGISDTNSYRVTAVNNTATSFVDLRIKVNIAAPGPLTYTFSSAVYTTGVAIVQNTCTNPGGLADSFTVSPALPPGLQLNRTTGAITGKPTIVRPVLLYTISASNKTGRAEVQLSLSVANPDDISNPVVVRGSRGTDNRHIDLRLTQYSAIKSVQDPLLPWVDSIVVWYKAGAAPVTPSRTDTNRVSFSLTQMKAQSEPFTKTITVPAITSGAPYYYLNVSQYWHTPDSIPPFVSTSGDAVLMTDTTTPLNNLLINGYYPGQGGDSAEIRVQKTGTIDTAVIATVTVLCGFSSDTAGAFYKTEFPADTVLRRSQAGVFTTGVRNSLFKGALDTVYCFVYLTSKTGVRSRPVSQQFFVGGAIPANPITTLTATPLNASQIRLQWNSVTGVDSIRIVYGIVPVPTTSNPPGSFLFFCVGRIKTDTVVRSLSPQTQYYFGAQVMVGGNWSSISAVSSATATTLAADTTAIRNTIGITRAWFDSLTNRIGVAWRCDRSVAPSLEFGVTYGLADTLNSATMMEPQLGDHIGTVTASSETTWIDLSQSIVFDTSFSVLFWLRKLNGVWSAPVDSSRALVRTGTYSWQVVQYFTGNAQQAVQAFNESVLLVCPSTSKWTSGEILDTLRYFTPAVVPAGMSVIQPGFTFTNKATSQPFLIGVRYNLPPEMARNVLLYRCLPNNKWLALHGCINDTINSVVWFMVSPNASELELPFIAAVNNLHPGIVAPGGDAVVPADSGFVQSLQVRSGVANAIVTFLYGTGRDSLRVQQTVTLADTVQTLELPVSYLMVKADYGLRAIICVNDGVHVDTVNVSRRVRRSRSDMFSTEFMQWIPVRSTAILDNPAASYPMNMLLDQGGKWSYDNTQFRMFRWWPRSENTADARKWVEYSDALQDSFKVLPGRLMWLKSKVGRAIDFGAATTLSLRDTFSMTLPPGNWTDFALPYRFVMKIGDILDATGTASSSLHFYKWVKAGTQFTTQPLFVPGIAGGQYVKRTDLLSSDALDGYSVWNNAAQPVVLRIPPVPSVMSRVTSAQQKQRNTAGEWLLSINASSEAGALPVVLCGFSNGQAKQSYYPQSPSFGDAGVRVLDPVSGRYYGHVMQHRQSNGGSLFQLDFYNNAQSEEATIAWTVGSLGLDGGRQVFVVDPLTRAFHRYGAVETVTLAPGASKLLIIAVGNEQFASGAMQLNQMAPFALLGSYPNPFRSAMTVRYSVPYCGVARVVVDLVDAHGRIVWKSVVNKPAYGVAQVVWNGSVKGMRRASAGMYMLRITGFNDKGAIAGRHQRQVTFMP